MSEMSKIDAHLAQDAKTVEFEPNEFSAMLAERDARIADLENRLENQEYSLRRVLDMLIEWLEQEPQENVVFGVNES
ncbi:MAG: hypothetical protein EP341_10080 [Sphingomonadales bacterium]|nr:MAG: hypothetical protein EP341_10080 [Sphingomonadales bacterium]